MNLNWNECSTTLIGKVTTSGLINAKKLAAALTCSLQFLFLIMSIGENCEVIPPLQYGNSTCNVPVNETTDATCSFFCNQGFDIYGSISRTCQANHKWNGTMTTCKSKLTVI